MKKGQKLTPEQVRFARMCQDARRMFPGVADLAREWGVQRDTLNRAVHRRTFKAVR